MTLESAQRDLVQLVSAAVDAASTPEELLDCAYAAAGTGDKLLMKRVADRVGNEIAEMLEGASAWHVQASYSKLDSWKASGEKVKLLAQAWGAVGRPLLEQR